MIWILNGIRRVIWANVGSVKDKAHAYNVDVLSNTNIAVKNQYGGSLSSKASDSLVLICGAVGSGKTRLFHRLLMGKDYVPSLTVSSSVASQGKYVSSDEKEGKSRSIDLMDYPGHARLRNGLLNRAMLSQSRLKRILFIVDSSTSLTESADFFYDILLSAQNKLLNKNVEILVCCNKVDTKLAKNYKRIQLQMKAELNRLRGTRGTMSTEGNDDGDTGLIEGPQLLGQAGVSLDWDSVPCNVSFVSCSCEDGQGLGEIREFIEGSSK